MDYPHFLPSTSCFRVDQPLPHPFTEHNAAPWRGSGLRLWPSDLEKTATPWCTGGCVVVVTVLGAVGHHVTLAPT